MNDHHKRRIFRIALAALLTSMLMILLLPVLGQWDSQLFAELLEAFQDLSGDGAKLAEPSTSPSSITSLVLSTYIFSAGAAVLAYRVNHKTLPFFVIQLCILSVVFQSVIFYLTHLSGNPASLLASIILGGLAGLWFKQNDENRLAQEALQIQLELRNREILESRLTIVKQDERERRLLAADLHDQVLNDLKKISQQLDTLPNEGNQSSANSIQAELKKVMSDIREIMDNLCPVVLEHFGLIPATEECLEKGAQRAGFDFSIEDNAPEILIDNLSTVEKQLLFRLIQESITNICKHAEASQVTIKFEDGGNQLLIVIEDDGKGIAKEAIAESSRGLLYMKLRAALIGAQIHWFSGRESPGTRVEIRALPKASGS